MADEPTIELINDKWQNILPQYESNRFDLAIVDPPYGIGEDGSSNGTRVGGRHESRNYKPYFGGDKKIPDKEYFIELKRVSKNQIIWGGNYMVKHIEPSMGWIFWEKDTAACDFSDGEFAYTSFNKAAKHFKYTWNGFRQGPTNQSIEDRIHPNQKPVALYRWLMSKYAKPGDTILDTHLGSGSSAIAAWQKKHDFTGIECDKYYFDKALHRFNMNTNREYALEEWQKQSEQNGQQTIFSQ